MEPSSEKPLLGPAGGEAPIDLPIVYFAPPEAAHSSAVLPRVAMAPAAEPALPAGVPSTKRRSSDGIESRRSLRRVKLPVILFAATCLSTFLVGLSSWDFLAMITEPIVMVRRHWQQGATYMLAVMGILLAHEMGHFLQALRYGVPASLPFFIPLPITPLGTMGAVIALGGSQADRKQLFDIGLTGPLAGLALGLPLMCLGLMAATPFPPASDASLGGMHFGEMLIFKLLVWWLRPDVAPDARLIVFANPLVVAGWVGMFVTGLNMLPIGQLDGGHVAYALLGRRAWWLARFMLLAAAVFIVWAGQYGWLLMLGVVLFLGIRHPPTSNDGVALGRGRWVLGWLSLLIPVLCFPPFPLLPTAGFE